jgi:D-3-phosphoglycerate dehydrogenase
MSPETTRHVLVLDHIFRDLEPERAVLSRLGIEVTDGTSLDPAVRLESAREAEALLVQYAHADAALIGTLRRCRVIGSYGVGYDQIDLAAADARGITVIHVPDYGTEEVSDHALCLLLACARGLPRLTRTLAGGGWDYRAALPLHRLRGCTLGLVGLGRIGRRVADKARAFGLRVVATDPYVAPAVFEKHGVEPRALSALLAESHFISLHVPLTSETRGLLDDRALARVRLGAYLINVARGPLVDEVALLGALEAGRLAGAGLDVLAAEPPPTDHPLLRHPKVLVTPHSAWSTEEAMRDLQRLLAEDVARVLSGQPPRCPVVLGTSAARIPACP